MGKGAIITRKIKEDIRYIFEEEERYNNKNWENSGFFFSKEFFKNISSCNFYNYKFLRDIHDLSFFEIFFSRTLLKANSWL